MKQERRLRVLAVDDNFDSRMVVSLFLKRLGHDYDTADSGRRAIELVNGPKPFDLVLMDMQMPEMDGYEATTKLRAMGYKKPIVALTAHAMRDELDRCLKAGCDMTLTKPITKAALVEHLAKILA